MKKMILVCSIIMIYSFTSQSQVSPYKDRPGSYNVIPAIQAINEGKAKKEVLDTYKNMDNAHLKIAKIIKSYEEIKKQVNKIYWPSIDITIKELNLITEIYTGRLLMFRKDGNGVFFMNNTSIDFIAKNISKYGLFLPNKEWASQEFYSFSQLTPFNWVGEEKDKILNGYWTGAYVYNDGVLLPGLALFEAVLKGNYLTTYEGGVWNENRLKMSIEEKQKKAAYAVVLHKLITSEIQSSQFQEAIKHCTEYLCIIPYDFGVFCNRAIAKIGIKDFNGALVDCNTGINCISSQQISNNEYDMNMLSILQALFLNRGIAKLYLNDKVGSDEDYQMSKSLKKQIESISK